MSLALPSRIVLSSSVSKPVCTEAIAVDDLQIVRVDTMACCVKKMNLCIAQNSDKTFQFQDTTDVDFSTATEVNFDIWESINGASVLSKSLTGGDITVASPNVLQMAITDTESGAMSATRKYCELWVTVSGGDRFPAGAGVFRVIDTRKFD